MNEQHQGDAQLSKRQLKGMTRIPEEDTIIFDSKDWIMIIPHTHRSAIYWGEGTLWDTSYRGESMWFDSYNRQGNLIIIKNKENPQQLFQFQIETGLFFNANNEAVIFKEFFLQHEELKGAVIQHIQNQKETLNKFESLCF